jgi:hypothetical protein
MLPVFLFNIGGTDTHLLDDQDKNLLRGVT